MKKLLFGLGVLAFSFAFASSVSATPLPDDLVGWWQFDETGFTTVTDYAGNDNQGALMGTTATQSGGNVSLTGTGYVSVDDHDDLDITGAITIEARMNISDLPNTYSAVVSKGQSHPTDASYMIHLDELSPTTYRVCPIFYLPTGGYGNWTAGCSGSLDYDTDYNVAVIFDGYNEYTYINGSLSSSEDRPDEAILTSFGPLEFGHDSRFPVGQRHMIGTIDDIRIWKTALAAVELGMTDEELNIFLDVTAPTMESITPDNGAYIRGVQDFVFDFNDANPLAYLELDIVGPTPYNTPPTRIQVTFPAGDITDPGDLAMMLCMGVNVVYDEGNQKWTVSIDTTKTWDGVCGLNPWGIPDGDKVYPDGTYDWYIQVNDVAGNHWGDMYATLPETTRHWIFDNTAPADLTPEVAYNPVGTEHTYTTSINVPAGEVNVLFVVTGANAQVASEPIDENGDAEFTYTGVNSGKDEIYACVDTDGDLECEGDMTNTVTKYWLSKFVTGGGNLKEGKKVVWTFAGNVGIANDESQIVGNFQINDHEEKVSCHFDDFTSLVFINDQTVTFSANGSCNKGEGDKSVVVTITDNGEPGSSDTIKVDDYFNINTVSISGGNFQVRAPVEDASRSYPCTNIDIIPAFEMFPGSVYDTSFTHTYANAAGTITVCSASQKITASGLTAGRTYTVYVDTNGIIPGTVLTAGPWQKKETFTADSSGNGFFDLGLLLSGTYSIFINDGGTMLISYNFTLL